MSARQSSAPLTATHLAALGKAENAHALFVGHRHLLLVNLVERDERLAVAVSNGLRAGAGADWGGWIGVEGGGVGGRVKSEHACRNFKGGTDEKPHR